MMSIGSGAMKSAGRSDADVAATVAREPFHKSGQGRAAERAAGVAGIEAVAMLSSQQSKENCERDSQRFPNARPCFFRAGAKPSTVVLGMQVEHVDSARP